ncbi:MAG: hypothetical protein AAGD25_06850 [Cyanobacteria bacterium P01_F01_bin.150]
MKVWIKNGNDRDRYFEAVRVHGPYTNYPHFQGITLGTNYSVTLQSNELISFLSPVIYSLGNAQPSYQIVFESLHDEFIVQIQAESISIDEFTMRSDSPAIEIKTNTKPTMYRSGWTHRLRAWLYQKGIVKNIVDWDRT